MVCGGTWPIRFHHVGLSAHIFLDGKKQLVLTKHLGADACISWTGRNAAMFLVVGDVLFDNVLNGCLHFHDLKSYMVFNGFILIN